jgi:LysM repeat protein
MLSKDVLKTAIIIFVVVAFANSIVFGISEYNREKNHIEEEIKSILEVSKESLSEAVWKSNKDFVENFGMRVLENSSITGIKIVDYGNKYVEIDKVKTERGKSIEESKDLIYNYSGKKVKIAKVIIFSDSSAVFDKSIDTVLLLFLKILIETVTIYFILAWGLKSLFSQYILRIREETKKGNLIEDHEKENSLSMVEKKFQTTVSHLIEVFKHKGDVVDIDGKDKNTLPAEVEIPEENVNRELLLQIFDYINPSNEIYKRFFKSKFFAIQSAKTESGDIVLFSEIEKGKDLLLFMVNYGELQNVTALEISLALKDIEKDILLKYHLNNQAFSTSKMLEFMDKKLRNRFIENGASGVENAQLSGLVMNISLENSRIEYSSKNMLIFEDDGNNFSLYDDFGLFNGKNDSENSSSYKDNSIGIEPTFSYYIASSGFAEQTKSGKESEKIGRAGLFNALKSIKDDEFTKQANSVISIFNKLKGEKRQDRDMTVIGFKI